jgi:hypothetical protein
VIHDVLCREVDAVARGRAARDDEVDDRPARHGASPLDVEVRLALVVLDDPRVRPVDRDDGIQRGQAEETPERLHVGDLDVGLGDHGDRLSPAVDAGGQKRRRVVNGGEVRGSQALGPVREGNGGTGARPRDLEEVVERHDPTYDVREGTRHLGVADVRAVEPAAGEEVPHRGPERRLHLRDGAAEVDPASPRRDRFDRETVPLEPAEDGVQIGIREAELAPVLFGRQPAVVVR